MDNSSTKTAVVTGGNCGIGLALTKKLLAQNYKVIITSRSGEVSLEHRQLEVVQLDLNEESSIKGAAADIRKLTSQVELLVINAGIADDIALQRPTMQTFKATLDVNLTGTVFFTEALRDHLNEQAQIVFISSEMGLLAHAEPNAYAYRISKAALNFYAKLLTKSYHETDVKVVTIHPGWVRTKLGGDQAPLHVDEAAAGIYKVVEKEKTSGDFFNIQTGAQFTL
jgi:NAD(P)-dependent dehydrogenase (short-subunit alcohol dehydrogenase family)